MFDSIGVEQSVLKIPVGSPLQQVNCVQPSTAQHGLGMAQQSTAQKQQIVAEEA